MGNNCLYVSYDFLCLTNTSLSLLENQLCPIQCNKIYQIDAKYQGMICHLLFNFCGFFRSSLRPCIILLFFKFKNGFYYNKNGGSHGKGNCVTGS